MMEDRWGMRARDLSWKINRGYLVFWLPSLVVWMPDVEEFAGIMSAYLV